MSHTKTQRHKEKPLQFFVSLCETFLRRRMVVVVDRIIVSLSILLLMTACQSAPPWAMTARRALSAAELAGKVYAVGGWNGEATQLDQVEVFDPSTQRWDTAPPLQQARSQHAVIAADGRLWVIGGWSAEGGLVSAIERWSPGQAAWEIITHLPTPRREPAAALLGRWLVVAGGFHGINDGDGEGYSDWVEAYDLDSGRWQQLARLPTPRRGLTLVNVADQLYALGGYSIEAGFLAVVEQYDPASNRWISLDWPLVARTWAAAAVNDGAIFVIGGYSQNGYLGLIERIDPATGTICYPASLKTPRSWLAAVPLPNGILTLGGESARGFENAAEWVTVDCKK